MPEKVQSYAFYIGGIDPGKIDKTQGIVRDVRVMTQGVALGHDVSIDAKTLSGVITASQEYRNGIKVKMDHEGGAGDIVGWVDNFRQQFDDKVECVIGDLHLIKTHPQRDYILELASTIPDTFGLSLFFIGPKETIDGVKFARCAKIFSCDIVTEPAANAEGLFKIGERLLLNAGPIVASPVASEKTPSVDKKENTRIETKKAKTMEPEEFAKCMAEYEANKASGAIEAGAGKVVPTKETHQVNEDGSEKHVVTKGPTSSADGGEEQPEEMKKKMKAEIRSELMAELRQQFSSKSVKVPAGTTSAEAVKLEAKIEDKSEPKTFEDLCVHLREKGDASGRKLSPTEAISYATKYHAKLHQEYLMRCQQESPMIMQHRAALKGGQRFDYKPMVEHWKVQGTPNPELMRL